MARYIFITGGVVSSLGKGLASAALGALLQARGYTVRLRKLDPYLNRRSGHDVARISTARCSSPTTAPRPISTSAITSASPASRHQGRQHHHRAHLSGHPHQGAPRRLSRRHHPGDPARHQRHQGIHPRRQRRAIDFVLVEIGGTVGDIEGLPFFEAIRQIGNDLPREHAHLHPPDAAALHPDAPAN